MVESLKEAVEDLLSADLALVLGVVSLGLQCRSELDCGDEEGAGLADRLEVTVEFDRASAVTVPSMRWCISLRSLAISVPSASAGSSRAWS